MLHHIDPLVKPDPFPCWILYKANLAFIFCFCVVVVVVVGSCVTCLKTFCSVLWKCAHYYMLIITMLTFVCASLSVLISLNFIPLRFSGNIFLNG